MQLFGQLFRLLFHQLFLETQFLVGGLNCRLLTPKLVYRPVQKVGDDELVLDGAFYLKIASLEFFPQIRAMPQQLMRFHIRHCVCMYKKFKSIKSFLHECYPFCFMGSAVL